MNDPPCSCLISLYNILYDTMHHFPSRLGVPVVFKDKNKKVDGATVVVGWEPPFDGACPVVGYKVYYREVILPAGKSKWTSNTVSRAVTSHTLQLKCSKKYEIAVTSLNAYKESDLIDSRILKFTTGGGNSSLVPSQITRL